MIERGQQWSRRDFVFRCVTGSIVIAVLSSCGGERRVPEPSPPPPPPAPTALETVVPTPTPPENTPTPQTEQLPEPVVTAVKAAAADAGVAEDAVMVVSFSQRAWPSTALGCPRPGFSYAQVVTPGYEIHLQAGAKDYEYHTNMSTNVVLCSG